MSHDFECSPEDSHTVPGAAARTTAQNLSSAYQSEKVSGRGFLEHQKPYQLPVIWARDTVVTRVRCFGMRSTPDKYLVEGNRRVITVFEREREVGI